jgi:hypothetical protein
MTTWTPPLTYTAGMAMGAAGFNTYIRDNLNALKEPPFGRTACNPTGVANISTTSTVWTAISAAISLTLTTYGGAIHCGFQGIVAGDNALMAFEIDGTAYTGVHPSGVYKAPTQNFSFDDWISEITASGSHVIRPAWRVAAGTQTAQLACSGMPAIFWAREG